MTGYAVPGGIFLLNAPFGQGRDLGPPAARGPAGPDREEAEVLRDRRDRGGQEDRDGRPHQHHHADLLLRGLRRPAARRGHRQDQEDDREDLRQEGRGGRRRRTTPPWTRRSPTCTRSRCRRRSPPPRGRPAIVSDAAPDFVKRVSAVIIEQKGDLLPVSAFTARRHLAHGDEPVGEAEHRHRDPGLGREGLHPGQQVRAHLPARGHPREGLRAGPRSAARRRPSSRSTTRPATSRG